MAAPVKVVPYPKAKGADLDKFLAALTPAERHKLKTVERFRSQLRRCAGGFVSVTSAEDMLDYLGRYPWELPADVWVNRSRRSKGTVRAIHRTSAEDADRNTAPPEGMLAGDWAYMSDGPFLKWSGRDSEIGHIRFRIEEATVQRQLAWAQGRAHNGSRGDVEAWTYELKELYLQLRWARAWHGERS